MTRIDFHFNAPAGYAGRLVRRIHRVGQRIVVFGAPDAIEALDRLLWTISALDFIPHVRADDPLAAETPVILCSAPFEPPHTEVLVNLADSAPSFFSRFERVIEVVGADPDRRNAARERWRFYRDRGYPLQSHDIAT